MTVKETHRRVVRAFGSGVIHVADIHPDQFRHGSFCGADYVEASAPTATVCGAVLRYSGAVCMAPGTRVTCKQCRRLSRLEKAADYNNKIPQEAS